MLTITLLGRELFDEEVEEFITISDLVLDLEHSLVSLSKWESKFQKPFLGPDVKSSEEMIGYIEAMILTPNYPTDFWQRITTEHLNQINAYIESNQSATTFGQMPDRKARGEVITSELIYYWLVAFNVPLNASVGI